MTKKSEFFIKQGYKEKTVLLLESCGVKKHMLWFLNNIPHDNGVVQISKHIITGINEYLETLETNNYKNFEMASHNYYVHKSRVERMNKNTLYKFDDGFSIVKIDAADVKSESSYMSNCIYNYGESIEDNYFAILALKDKNMKTLVHFQILRNGSLAQNYEKANAFVRYKNWSYVVEFFKIHSKNINLSKFDKDFNFGWVFDNRTGKGIFENTLMSVELIAPSHIEKNINEQGHVSTHAYGKTIKLFTSKLPNNVKENSHNKNIFFNDKSSLLKKIEDIKNNITQCLEDLIKQINITEGEFLYLSDEMKERIFGENNYTLEGDNYKFVDLFEDHNLGLREMAVEPDLDVENAEVIGEIQPPQLARQPEYIRPPERVVDVRRPQIRPENGRDEIVNRAARNVIRDDARVDRGWENREVTQEDMGEEEINEIPEPDVAFNRNGDLERF